MNLPRHAAIYLLFIGALSLFQVALGSNLIVLAAIDFVCLSALYPLTRKNFDPNDLLFLSLCLHYGTFSLILKSIVLQPVQMNLKVPLATSGYLVGGFGIIFLCYVFVDRTMTRYYPKTKLRRWKLLERTYANEHFLAHYTLPLSIFALLLTTVVSFFSHSAQEVALNLASSSTVSAIGSLLPIIQLAFAMQLSLLARRGSYTDAALVIITLVVALGLSVLNNQKQLAFILAMTYVVHLAAYRIRVRPRFIALVAVGITVVFFYVTPVIHIVRDMEVEKSQRIPVTIQVLKETNFNPLTLIELDSKVSGTSDYNSLERQIDYLSPNNFTTDRLTLLMPIDQTARFETRAPLGFDEYVHELAFELLPKYLVGQHNIEVLADIIAWRFTIRQDGIISRPTLGLFGTGYGVDGAWGVFVIAPFMVLSLFALVKLVCNGSIWQNPFAIFVGSYMFFEGEDDVTLWINMARGFIPILIIAFIFVIINNLLNGSAFRRTIGNPRLSPTN